MNTYKTQVDQLEAGQLSQVKELFEAKSPTLWNLCHQLLDVDGAAGSHWRAMPIPDQINLTDNESQDEGVSMGKKTKLKWGERNYGLLDTLTINLKEYNSPQS